MKIQAFSTLGEISHFAISGYFVISGFDITGVNCSFIYIREPIYFLKSVALTDFFNLILSESTDLFVGRLSLDFSSI